MKGRESREDMGGEMVKGMTKTDLDRGKECCKTNMIKTKNI